MAGFGRARSGLPSGCQRLCSEHTATGAHRVWAWGPARPWAAVAPSRFIQPRLIRTSSILKCKGAGVDVCESERKDSIRWLVLQQLVRVSPVAQSAELVDL